MSAYVLQDDIFFAELTVYETITLSAQLRYGQSANCMIRRCCCEAFLTRKCPTPPAHFTSLCADVSKEERKKRVDSIIRELGMYAQKASTAAGEHLYRTRAI